MAVFKTRISEYLLDVPPHGMCSESTVLQCIIMATLLHETRIYFVLIN